MLALLRKFLPGVDLRFALAALVAVVLLVFMGVTVDDLIARKHQQDIATAVATKDSQIQETKKAVNVAELKAAEESGKRMVAEKNLQTALQKLDAFTRQKGSYLPGAQTYPSDPSAPSSPLPGSGIDLPTLPAPPDCLQVVEELRLEHEARVDCVGALGVADAEIDARKVVEAGLHTEVTQLEDKNALQAKEVVEISEDRDKQEHRKKLWRNTAFASTTAAILILLL